MAQYIPTIALGQLKGSIGSTTFQGGNNSSVIRHKGYRQGSRSQARSSATTILARVTTSWRALTDLQRRGWIAGAALWQFTNKFGVPYFASPYQFYTAYNVNNFLAVGSLVTAPNIPIAPVNYAPFLYDTLTPSSISFKWSTPFPNSSIFWVFASAPHSAGRNDNNIKFRFISTYGGTSNTLQDISAEYFAIYPQLLVGQKVTLKIYTSLLVYPYKYYPFILSDIAT